MGNQIVEDQNKSEYSVIKDFRNEEFFCKTKTDNWTTISIFLYKSISMKIEIKINFQLCVYKPCENKPCVFCWKYMDNIHIEIVQLQFESRDAF